jgi:hypothetical protein
MNPWHEKLGCEVNVCQTKYCDAVRMVECALRKAWQQRMARLKMDLNNARSEMTRQPIAKLIKGLTNYDK